MYLNLRKHISLAVLLAFLLNTFGPMPAYAQQLVLPKPGVMVHLSPPMTTPMLKGLKVHPDNPFKFDFILDKGDEKGTGYLFQEELKTEANKLIKYFLASLTTPEKDLWVNLSPYEKDRVIPQSFGLTEMGRDLLAQDYMLKQITASLIYPEDEIGKKFWKRVYEEAAHKYNTTNISVNTFNKVWIVPEKAVVYENSKAGTAYVVVSKLKVMLEEDYLSLQKHGRVGVAEGGASPATGRKEDDGDTRGQDPDMNRLGSQIIREIVIPELTREINEGQNFAQLRQVYNSLILAAWYKKKIKDSILSQVYADKNKTAGIDTNDPQANEKIYQQYLQAFKKGVYNYIKEEQDPITQQTIPRKYFSGGAIFGRYLDRAMSSTQILPDTANLNREFQISVRIDAAMTTATKPTLQQITFEWGSPEPGLAQKFYDDYLKDRQSSLQGKWGHGDEYQGRIIEQLAPQVSLDNAQLTKERYLKAGARLLTPLQEEDFEKVRAYQDKPRFKIVLGDHGVELKRFRRFDTESWGVTATSFKFLDKAFRILDKISELDQERTDKKIPLVVVDWGCGQGVTLRGLKDELDKKGIENVILVGFSDQYFKQWEEAPEGITFIYDVAENFEKNLNHLGIKNVDLIYSYLGLMHFSRDEHERSSRHLIRLVQLLSPNGDLRLDSDIPSKEENLKAAGITIEIKDRVGFYISLVPNTRQALVSAEPKQTQDAAMSGSVWTDWKTQWKYWQIRRRLGLPKLDLSYVFNIEGRQQKILFSDERMAYVIGDLVFIVLDDLRYRKKDLITVNWIKYLTHSYQLSLGRLYTANPKKILFISPFSAVQFSPLNAHTGGIIAAMLDKKEQFKDSVVVDVGAGSGILSLVALSLGAKKAILIEQDKKEIVRAVGLLEAQGYQKDKDFYIIGKDLSGLDSIEEKIRKIGIQSKVIGLENIGPWSRYGSANSQGLNLLTSLNADLIFNGGYLVQAEDTDGRFRVGFDTSVDFLRTKGFSVQKIEFPSQNKYDYGGIMLMVARSKALQDQAMNVLTAPVMEERLIDLVDIDEHVFKGQYFQMIKERINNEEQYLAWLKEAKDFVLQFKSRTEQGRAFHEYWLSSLMLLDDPNKTVDQIEFNPSLEYAGPQDKKPEAVTLKVLTADEINLISQWGNIKGLDAPTRYAIEHVRENKEHHFVIGIISQHKGQKFLEGFKSMFDAGVGLNGKFMAIAPWNRGTWRKFKGVGTVLVTGGIHEAFNRGYQGRNFSNVSSSSAPLFKSLGAVEMFTDWQDMYPYWGFYAKQAQDAIKKQNAMKGNISVENLLSLNSFVTLPDEAMKVNVEDGLRYQLSIVEGMIDLLKSTDGLVYSNFNSRRFGESQRGIVVWQSPGDVYIHEPNDEGNGLRGQRLNAAFQIVNWLARKNQSVVEKVLIDEEAVIKPAGVYKLKFLGFKLKPSVNMTMLHRNIMSLLYQKKKEIRSSLNGADKAMTNTGGIDLTAEKTPLEVQNTAESIKFNLDPAMLQQFQNAPGFYPVIINIQPMTDLKSFLAGNPAFQESLS